MQLVFTGAPALLSPNTDVEKSLGGYVSNTPVPNNRLNGLFSDISEYGKANKIVETLAICLYNTSGSTKTNVKLTEIYSNQFLDDDSGATYEWAAVTLNSGKMESIQSKGDSPFYATFIEPKSRRADAILKVLTGGGIGDVITVLGVSTLGLSGTSIENLVDAVVLSFVGNATYIVTKKSASEIYFQIIIYAVDTTAVTLSSTGLGTATPTAFSNGYDGTVLLTASLADNDGIGLWIRRTIKPNIGKTCQALLDAINDIPKTIDNLEVVFSWD